MSSYRLYLVPCLFFLASCHIDGGLGVPPGPQAPQNPPPAPAQQPPAQQPSAGGSGAGAAAGGAGGGDVHAGPDCPHPDNHCLGPNDILVAKKGYEKRHVYLDPAVQQGEVTSSGEASFLSRRTGETLTTRHFFQTYPATADQLAVGKLAAMPRRKKGGMYRAPENTKHAHKRWWLARIVSVVNVPDGYVIVAGGHKISIDAIRLVEGDESPTVVVSGAEDEHFVKESHWFIARKGLPEKRHVYATIAAAVKPPSPDTKGEGQFIDLKSGEILWTSHAWKTRRAAEADFQIGNHLFMPRRKKSGTYQAPRERSEALSKRWWVAKLVDPSAQYKGVVEIAGGHKVAVDATRVVR